MLWSAAELPGTTVSSAAVDGVAFAAIDAIINGAGTGAKFLLSARSWSADFTLPAPT